VGIVAHIVYRLLEDEEEDFDVRDYAYAANDIAQMFKQAGYQLLKLGRTQVWSKTFRLEPPWTLGGVVTGREVPSAWWRALVVRFRQIVNPTTDQFDDLVWNLRVIPIGDDGGDPSIFERNLPKRPETGRLDLRGREDETVVRRALDIVERWMQHVNSMTQQTTRDKVSLLQYDMGFELPGSGVVESTEDDFEFDPKSYALEPSPLQAAAEKIGWPITDFTEDAGYKSGLLELAKPIAYVWHGKPYVIEKVYVQFSTLPLMTGERNYFGVYITPRIVRSGERGRKYGTNLKPIKFKWWSIPDQRYAAFVDAMVSAVKRNADYGWETLPALVQGIKSDVAKYRPWVGHKARGVVEELLGGTV